MEYAKNSGPDLLRTRVQDKIPTFFNLYIFLFLCLPIIPKIEITTGINVYLPEIYAVLISPLIIINFSQFVRFKIPFYFFLYWIVILVSTAISMFYVPNIPEFMKVLKPFLYLPLFSLAYSFGPSLIRHIVIAGLLAFIVNGFFAWDVFLSGDLLIFTPQNLVSGMSNRIFSLGELELTHTNRGAHGIWGSYCALIIVASLIAQRFGLISRTLLSFVIIGAIVSIFLTVSREASIVLLAVAIGWSAYKANTLVLSLIISIAAFYFALANLDVFNVFEFVNIPLIYKIENKILLILKFGSEHNILARVNTWSSIISHLIANPSDLLFGIGMNLEYAAELIGVESVKYVSESAYFTHSAESLLFGSLFYGGVGGLIFICAYLYQYFALFLSAANRHNRWLLGCFMFGILFGNTFSGSSIMSDLLMSQMLLFSGALCRLWKEHAANLSSGTSYAKIKREVGLREPKPV